MYMKNYFGGFKRTKSTVFEAKDKTKYDSSIVFIEDTKQIYTNGVYYGGSFSDIDKVEFNETSIEMEPNKFYYCNNLLDSLDISLIRSNDDILNTYYLEFVNNNTQVFLPNYIHWQNNIIPDLTKESYKVTIKIQDDTAYLINSIFYEYGDPGDPEDEFSFLTFTALEDGCVVGLSSLSTNQSIEYSYNETDWTSMSSSDDFTLNKTGDKVYIRGILSGDNSTDDYTNFIVTNGSVATSGCVSSIWDYRDLTAPLKAYCGYKLFSNCVGLTTTPELPTTTLAEGCYCHMFNGCTRLTTAPELPATTLADKCYQEMFNGCTSLIIAPELPATKLAKYCYTNMLSNCTSLITAPELPATTLAEGCYKAMFDNCASLTTAPELPATVLADYCYYNMFRVCQALTKLPDLPATELAKYCYNGMFQNCDNTQITSFPVLPALTLVEGCYNSLFKDASRAVRSITCLAVNNIINDNTSGWMQNLRSSGTFYKNPLASATDWYRSAVLSGWTISDAQI